MRTRSKVLLTLLASVVLAVTGITAASAASTASATYAALGDSYSSGEGNPPFLGMSATDGCHRSAKAYSQLLIGTAGFPSTGPFAACSGATIDTFTSGMDGEAGQLTQLSATTSLVTLTLGGNDVGFSSTLEACMTRTHCQNSLGAGITSAIATTGQRLASLYSSILAAAPNAKVYVLGYPIFISSSPGVICQLFGLAPDETAWMASMTALFDSTIKATVAGIGSSRLRFVDDQSIFAGKEACSKSGADVNGIVLTHTQYSFHPTAAGQALMASTLAAAV